MKFYGITMEGKFVNQTLASVPSSFVAATDTGRVIYNQADGFLWWGDGETGVWRTIGEGGGDVSEAEDMYSDLLRTSVFLNATWNGFEETPDDDTYINETNTTMTHEAEYGIYNYAGAMVLETNNLYDSYLTSNDITYCMPSVWFIPTLGIAPSIQVMADGATWENAENNTIHEFTNPGKILKMRIISIAGQEGFIRNMGFLYHRDPSVTCRDAKILTTTITLSAGDDNIFEIDYAVGSTIVFLNGRLLDGSDFTATDGSTITIADPTLVVGDVVNVITFL